MHLNQLSNSHPLVSRPSFLLQCNGTNGSTSFVDAIGGLTMTVFGNAQVDTAQSQFGGASAKFDGTGDYLTLAANAATNLTEGDFTVECWVRISSSASADGIVLNNQYSAGLFQYGVYYTNTGSTLTINGYHNNNALFSFTSGTMSKNTWHHVALVRHGKKLQGFINGASIGTNTLYDLPLKVIANVFSVGGYFNGNVPFFGWIDSIRIWKGRALYLDAFTPPTAEFTDHS